MSMRKTLFSIATALLCFTGCTSVPKTCEQPYEPIQIAVPERPAGQQDAVGLTAPKIDTVRVGFIGVGMRGISAVERWTHIPGVQIKALCDLRPELVEKAQKTLVSSGMPEAATYSGAEDAWKQLCNRDDIDLVYVVTDWKHHAEMGVYAMEHGKHVAIEVPAAMTLNEIWALINTSEKTRKHCMQLENCVYDFFELTTLNMAQQGLFGEILHVEGAYIHNLEEFWPYYWNNWRLDYNRAFRGDIYATHGMGPACQLLDIHRGDRMKTLVAMDTKAVTGPKLVKQYQKESAPDFQNGDHTMTFIRTEKGKTIHIQHDVMNPRPYSRMYQLMEKFGKYLVTPSLKMRAEAVGTKLYDTKAGGQAADFTYPDVDGKMVSLSDFKGKVVLVDVWATWCGPCRQQIPYLKKLEEEMHGTDVVFGGVSVDESKDKQKWLDFIKTEGLKGVQLLAGGWSKITKDYKITGIPRFMVFDKKGNIVSVDAPRPSSPELKKMLENELKK